MVEEMFQYDTRSRNTAREQERSHNVTYYKSFIYSETRTNSQSGMQIAVLIFGIYPDHAIIFLRSKTLYETVHYA